MHTGYARNQHAAAHTSDYVFNQLIPYIGNKRRLLDLIGQAIAATGVRPGDTFLDLFAGSGVVSRFAKRHGLRVIANDWEPYATAINTCAIACNAPPAFRALGGYPRAINRLNALAPREDWVTRHLCPRDDRRPMPDRERMFYMRKNGLRIDAMRHQIAHWRAGGTIDAAEAACLLAPLLYQACYRSNTSGVFKGFHRGWGGRTCTALYRIAGDLALTPAVFFDNSQNNEVACRDAAGLARDLAGRSVAIAYLDPPYNQHPYGSNYHVLNSIALWDKPDLPREITGRNKSAIRTDWRTLRRSAYNHRATAAAGYAALLASLNARYILTSYSTDGTIPLEDLIAANLARGHVSAHLRGYKRYRVSAQRFSAKPMNVEFVLVLNTRRASRQSADQIAATIRRAERSVLAGHLNQSRLVSSRRARAVAARRLMLTPKRSASARPRRTDTSRLGRNDSARLG